ncbi:thioredoxin family protein [Halorarius halobius]|uniref:thioredoxin family protein n=1 Tax=Halorarius halobius TaxID=2962671 RepID=UPI0020CE0111|nr:thioredoxin family protein [Halorarius halobius]
MTGLDREALFDRLVEADVLAEREDGVVRTDAFESTLDVYRATYGDADDGEFHATVAELFDLDVATAADRVADLGVTREQLCVLLSLRSHVDGADPEQLQAMVGMVQAVAPDSPVPDDIPELDDDFPTYLAGEDRVVVVFDRGCDPCEALKRDLGTIRAAAPDRVDFAGVDASETPAFLREYDVEAAPTALLFRDGEPVARLRGYGSPDRFREAFADHY